MRAQTKIIFEMFDTEGKSKSNPSCSQSQTNVSTLKNEKADTNSYATTENKGFYLDGSFKILEELPTGLYSNELSDLNGNFTAPIVLDIPFNEAVTSSGITLYFPLNDYPKSVYIRWYRDNQLLKEGEFYPNTQIFFCPLNVENYNKIILTFNGTQIPKHYLKLCGIDYGQALAFTSKDIIKSSIEQEIDLMCDEIAINSLDFEVKDKENLWDITSDNSVFFALQENQKISAFIIQDSNEIFLGKFYLQEIVSKNNIASFKAQDIIGLLDTEVFQGGYFDTTFQNFCATLLQGYKFYISTELKNKPIKGFLNDVTKRQALQQACFAVGAVADTQGSEGLNIYSLEITPSKLIKSNERYSGGIAENIKPFKSIQITSHNFNNTGEDTPTINTYIINKKGQGELQISDAVFVNDGNIDDVLEKVKKFYINKVKYTFSMPLKDYYKMGDMLMVSLKNSYIKGNIYQMQINLSGGLVAEIILNGYVTTLSGNSFTGEFYTSERGII